MSSVDLNTDGLDKLLRALKRRPPQIRVGVIGSGARQGGGPTNAEVGAYAEFGNPQRSWLRVPLIEQLDKQLARAGAFNPETIREIIQTSSLLPFCKKVALVAEDVVLGAFDTGGYGKWQPSNMAKKKVHQTLVETQQLRNSVTSEVKS